MLIDGTVTSLPSIVAAIGIIVNNLRASSRQKLDRRIKYDIDLIETICNKYDEVSNEFIILMSEVETRLYDVQEEIIHYGTDNESQRFMAETMEVVQKTLFLATYKNRIKKARNIKIDSEKLVKGMVDSAERIMVYIRVITYISKLFVVKYHETLDMDITRKEVIEVLKKEVSILDFDYSDMDIRKKKSYYLYDSREETIRNYGDYINSIEDSDKRKISSMMKEIIREFTDKATFDCFFLDEYEQQINNALKQVLK